MDRRKRTLVVVAVSLMAATVASASVYRAIKRIPVREIEVAHYFVVVASHPLEIGARITTSDVKRIGWPSSSPLGGGFTRVEDVIGRGVVTALAANEPLTEPKLAPKEAGAGLAPAIPPGMRAISVKVNDVIGVAGFAVQGARVDVLATVRRADNNTVTRVLVANVPVLRTGMRDEAEPAPSRADGADVATLLVTPAQAEQIALASAEGRITLMLRNPLDVDAPPTPGARLARLVDGGSDEPPVAAPRPQVAAPARMQLTKAADVVVPPPPIEPPVRAYTFEAIRAGKRTTETIQ
jgi:pilus assembly protein CpaB